MDVIDTVTADQVEVGDFIDTGDARGEVLAKDDEVDGITFTISDEDLYGDRSLVFVPYTNLIDLLGD